MNIDGVTAVIYCELGFEAELGRRIFILSRAVGILALAWEQRQQGGRIKGPMPTSIPYRYTGPARRGHRATTERFLPWPRSCGHMDWRSDQ
jgi:citrate synthase